MKKEEMKASVQGMDVAFEHSILAIFNLILTDDAKMKVIEELCNKMEIQLPVAGRE